MVVGTEGHMVLPTIKSVNEPQGGGERSKNRTDSNNKQKQE